jgi:proline iminopeptidase
VSPPDFFPALEPRSTGMLGVGGGHALYWEEAGNPAGTPVVFLHGGPGAGIVPDHRRFFDPKSYRIVLFEQRGTGRSTPLGALEGNTTAYLVADIERLRAHLGVERWVVFGGSWGSTLALAYAEAHPERCRGLILRGIFLCRQSEIDWWFHGMGTFFPEVWRAFTAPIPERERHDLLGAYYRRLTDSDPAIYQPAARAWCTYETSCATLLPDAPTGTSLGNDAVTHAKALIEAHYFKTEVRGPANDLVANLAPIRKVPAVIVQGRYDVICPPVIADELARAWPEAEYVIVPDAGHSALEPGIRAELVAATERMKTLA